MYAIYGLRLASSRPISGLAECPADSPHVSVSFDGLPAWFRRIAAGEHNVVHGSDLDRVPPLMVAEVRSGAAYYLRYDDQTEFLISSDGTEVWAEWPAPCSFEDTCVYLLGPILGFVLQLRGQTSLHASVVVADGRAIALVGEGGAGKSTTAAMFARRGFSILSDDVATVVSAGGEFLIQPGYPLLRLWPHSAEVLYGSRDALPPLTPTWDKLFLDLRSHAPRFEPRPRPLAALYVLGERKDDSEAPFVEPLAGREALLPLLMNTYGYRLQNAARRSRSFALLGALVSSVPIRKVTPHRDPARLGQLCDLILGDFARLECEPHSEANAIGDANRQL